MVKFFTRVGRVELGKLYVHCAPKKCMTEQFKVIYNYTCICIMYSIHVHIHGKPSNQLINKSFVVCCHAHLRSF